MKGGDVVVGIHFQLGFHRGIPILLFFLHVRMVSTSSIKTSSPGTLRWTITEILSLMNCYMYFLNVRKNWKRRCYRMKRKREILGIQPLVLETSGEFLAVS